MSDFGQLVFIRNGEIEVDAAATARVRAWKHQLGIEPDQYIHRQPLDIRPSADPHIWEAEWEETCADCSYIERGWLFVQYISGRGTLSGFNHLRTWEEARVMSQREQAAR